MIKCVFEDMKKDTEGKPTSVDIKGEIFNDELRVITEELEESYWVPFLKTPFDGLDKLSNVSLTECPDLHAPLVALNTNLIAAKNLLEFPYLLVGPYALTSKHRPDNFQELPMAEQIELSMDIALRGLEIGKRRIINTEESIRLMHQAILLIWSAFESYCKEVFILSLNERSQLYLTLLAHSELKDYFAVSQSAWLTLLEAHSFNLNGKLGTIVGSSRDFSSPQLLRNLFSKLYLGLPGEQKELEAALHKFVHDDELWKLGLRRHLIAHRCGIIDKEYLNKSGDQSQTQGTLLKLRGRDIAQGMGIVAQCAICIYGLARYCWPKPDHGAKRE